jgi:hypothetical protein
MANIAAQNDRRIREILDEESPKARPFNAAWRRLERIGFQPDYIYGVDEGEPPKGARW